MTASRFKKVKAITLPLLKMENEVEYYLKFDGPMFLGKAIDDKKEAATLANVTNLESGEQVQIICATVLRGILDEAYPGEEYVGKCFEIVKHRDLEKKYNTYSVCEVAEPEPEVGDETAPKTKRK